MMIKNIWNIGKKKSASARNRLTITLKCQLSIKITHPSCFTPKSMHFLFQAKPSCISHFQNFDNPENERKAGYTYMYICS